MEYLRNYVDVVVISQAAFTHRGEPWVATLNSSHSLIKKYKEVFEFRFVMPAHDSGSIWGREKAQRKSLNLGLYDLNSKDLVLINDVDEIPSREQIENALELGVNCFHSIPMIVSVNFINVVNNGYWKHGKAVSAVKFMDAQESREMVLLPNLRGMPGHHLTVINGKHGWMRKFDITPHLEMPIDTKLLDNLVELDLYPMLDGVKHPGGGRLKRVAKEDFDDLFSLAYKLMPQNFKVDSSSHYSRSKKSKVVAYLWVQKVFYSTIELDHKQDFGRIKGTLMQFLYFTFLPARIYRWIKSRLFMRSRIKKLLVKL